MYLILKYIYSSVSILQIFMENYTVSFVTKIEEEGEWFIMVNNVRTRDKTWLFNSATVYVNLIIFRTKGN